MTEEEKGSMRKKLTFVPLVAPVAAAASDLNTKPFSKSFFPSTVPDTTALSSLLSSADFLCFGDPASPTDPGRDPGRAREKLEFNSRPS